MFRRLWYCAPAILFEWFLRLFRLPVLRSSKIYSLWGFPALQPAMEAMGVRRAYCAYLRAKGVCPAYRQFLIDHNAPEIQRPRQLSQIPETNKDNYVKRFSVEERCHGGALPARGVVIDESSGSSGAPNNWVRGREERASVRRLLHHGFNLRFGKKSVFFLNCFALGPWATGMNVSMAMVDIAILKSIGPDKAKLENTLTLFEDRYTYVLAGYPPFIKDWLDTTELDLRPFELHLISGGEGCSEGLRNYFEQTFRTVLSSYGASDLEINVAAETQLSIALRRSCAAKPELARELFGREDTPMIFQYNPLDYFVQQSGEGELVVTVVRRTTAAPKIRYNIKDLGGTHTYRHIAQTLRPHGIDLDSLATPRAALPFLYVFGRNDLSVPFYGAKVFVTDLDTIIHDTPDLRARFHSFQMQVREDESMDKTLVIRLERRRGAPLDSDPTQLAKRFFDRLQHVNQDFREVSKLFGPEKIHVDVFDFEGGPFADRDIRVKNRYIEPS